MSDLKPTGEVHPAADVFPMLSPDDLKELAEDIRTNGLIHPIVLDHDGTLIDGRNRLAACRMAGVEPAFTTLNGHEPVAYILSSNINRRHMMKGQQAMAVVQVSAVNLIDSVRDLAGLYSVNREYVHRARQVHEYAPDLVAGVLSGSPSLNDAYAEAQQRKNTIASTEVRMKALREDAPDLADLVVEERMTLAEAEAALRTRRTEQQRVRTVATKNVADALLYLDPHDKDIPSAAADLAGLLDIHTMPSAPDLTPRRMRRCASLLNALAATLAGEEK